MFHHRAGDTDDDPTCLLRQHLLHSKLRDVDKAGEISLYKSLKISGRIVRKRLREKGARAIDDTIDRAETTHGRRGKLRRSWRFADVSVDQRQCLSRLKLGVGEVPRI